MEEWSIGANHGGNWANYRIERIEQRIGITGMEHPVGNLVNWTD